MEDRPPFQLEPYEDKTLPENQQLFSLASLAGHTIKCVVEPINDVNRYPYADFVIVTETMCWVAFKADLVGCCTEDGARIDICGSPWRGECETLYTYLSADEMLENGLVSQGAYNELKASEERKAAEAKADKAARLRAELAQLEGGAA